MCTCPTSILGNVLATAGTGAHSSVSWQLLLSLAHGRCSGNGCTIDLAGIYVHQSPSTDFPRTGKEPRAAWDEALSAEGRSSLTLGPWSPIMRTRGHSLPAWERLTPLSAFLETQQGQGYSQETRTCWRDQGL